MTIVIDASALLAALLEEPGGAAVRRHDDAVIGSVNLAEVVERLHRDWDAAAVQASLAVLDLTVLAIDRDLAVAAGLMRRATQPFGLSLGDRCCLALARRLGCPALTADRGWAHIAAAVGVEVSLIR